jgi:hypothetical protein
MTIQRLKDWKIVRFKNTKCPLTPTLSLEGRGKR